MLFCGVVSGVGHSSTLLATAKLAELSKKECLDTFEHVEL